MSSVCPKFDDDRISNLPVELKHKILNRLPLHDSVRTGILSKAWRKTWTMQPCLVLDKQFFLQVIREKNEEAHLSIFSAVVDMILSVHTGPENIEIYIPPKLHNHHIYQWIEHLPKEGIKVLQLDNYENDHACFFPSYIFDFANLQELVISKWILSPPPESVFFSNLIDVQLFDVSIPAPISFGTRLRYLYLYLCTGIEHLDLSRSNNLTWLLITLSATINWRWLENAKNLELLVLMLPADFNMSKSVNLIWLLSNCTRIHTLLLHDFFLEILGPDPSMLKRPAKQMVNLKKLDLRSLSYNLRQISNSLCLIRNLPNLEELAVTLDFQVTDSNSVNSTIERHLESIDWKDVVLDQLLTVCIRGVVGLRSVLQLTKILLASTPSLEEMSLFCSPTVSDPAESLRIKQEFLQLPRKSLQAQLYWFDDENEE